MNDNRVVNTNFDPKKLSSINAQWMFTFNCRPDVRSLRNSLNASRQIPMSSDGHLVEEMFGKLFDIFRSPALYESVRGLD